ncbi:MAG TPA: DNA polymerase IV [Methylococcaceae bacterium]|nr:DNA polymerase IV [Methylococcaceae bacterium]
MERRIAHLDMDAFYASVELLRYPQLRGQAVVVGGRGNGPQPDAELTEFQRLHAYVGRGVATTASYEARKLGVHSAMGLMKAAALAPHAILLPADFEAYRHYSRLFKAAVAEIAPCIENRGIDEIYIDVTDVPGETVSLAQRIKDNVRLATGLSCSIGVTPNKLLAKIASELDKPDGLTVLTYADLPTRVWPLSVNKINGVGPKASIKLEAIGIRTIGELAQAPVDLLIQRFGQHYGRWLSDAAHGRDDRPVVTVSEPKSLSRETTFERDLDPHRDRTVLTGILTALCERLSQDLDHKGYVGKTIGVKLRYEDFHTVTRDKTLASPVAAASEILRAARDCLRRVPLDRKLRLLGIRAASLSPTNLESVTDSPNRQAQQPAKVGETLHLFD